MEHSSVSAVGRARVTPAGWGLKGGCRLCPELIVQPALVEGQEGKFMWFSLARSEFAVTEDTSCLIEGILCPSWDGS